MSYQKQRNVRREARTQIGRFRGGKLVPVMAVPVKGNEGGMLAQSLTMELDPIAGKMVTPIYGELYSVFVPVQAIDAHLNPETDYAGLTEVVREKLLSGNPLFDLETPGLISRRMGVIPRKISGNLRVNKAVRAAHNSAVNHLRKRKYHDAALVDNTNWQITPAIIGETALERMQGVLDPDPNINGVVNLTIPESDLRVRGVGMASSSSIVDGVIFETRQDGGENYVAAEGKGIKGDEEFRMAMEETDYGGVAKWRPAVFAEMQGVETDGVSLVDFYNAETKDKLTRSMRQMLEENPEYGEEMVLRWAHGLSVDTGKVPFVIHEERRVFGRSIANAMDTAGIEADVMRSDMILQMNFTVPIPRTELGGIIVTFAVMKPDETIADQPHPILSDNWGADNFVADELALDPVPVTFRELDSNVDIADENVVAFYTGHNALKRTYVNYGLNGELDPTTVENKTAVWQLQIPLSVTPDNILYPEELDHYPFADNQAEVVTYTLSSNVVLQTPMIFGPTPVEEMQLLTSEDVFEEGNE